MRGGGGLVNGVGWSWGVVVVLWRWGVMDGGMGTGMVSYPRKAGRTRHDAGGGGGATVAAANRVMMNRMMMMMRTMMMIADEWQLMLG